MRSRPSRKIKPCPCNGTCRCHSIKTKTNWMPLVYLIIVWIAVGIIVAMILSNQPDIEYIEVDGKKCEISYHQDGVNSTGYSYGHNIAICPK